jgi:RNA recognition motif-containing protein
MFSRNFRFLILKEYFMGKKIYVGNLGYGVQSETLAEKFGQFGQVESSKIVLDRETNRSKGFGFVEMNDAFEADTAIEKLHGSDFGGRALTVNEARPMEKRDPSARPDHRFRRPDSGHQSNMDHSSNRW